MNTSANRIGARLAGGQLRFSRVFSKDFAGNQKMWMEFDKNNNT